MKDFRHENHDRAEGALMQPDFWTMVPGLVLFVTVGLVHALFPAPMLGYWTRFYVFFRQPLWSPFLRSPAAMRTLGIVFGGGALILLVIYLWQWFHQPVP